MSHTYFTLFSGGDGAGVGLSAAGYTHLGGVEYDPTIAAVAAQNGHHLTVADVCNVDPLLLPHGAPDWLHASPVCKNASQAKAGGEESTVDINTAEAVCRFLRAWEPRIFSLENVWGYRTFDAFKRICATLDTLGYFWDFEHVNAADYGVPQTRKRLILRARRDGLLFPLPQAQRWVGWYEAISDLVDALPASQFAPWQMERLPEEMTATTLVSSIDCTLRQPIEPANTVVCTGDGHSIPPRAFIIGGGNTNKTIIDSKAHMADQPMFTISASHSAAKQARAFLVDGKPANYAGDLQIMSADEPVVTLTASQPRHPFRAWLSAGRVVSMTPRALARFQSFPDWYVLPDKNSLACTVIGNAVPPRLMQAIAEGME